MRALRGFLLSGMYSGYMYKLRTSAEVTTELRKLFELGKVLRNAEHDLAPHALLVVRSLLWVLGAKEETPLDIVKDAMRLMDEMRAKTKN